MGKRKRESDANEECYKKFKIVPKNVSKHFQEIEIWRTGSSNQLITGNKIKECMHLLAGVLQHNVSDVEHASADVFIGCTESTIEFWTN